VLEVAAIGTNHGAGPTVALKAPPRDARRGPPARGPPNIGLASLAGGRVVYPHSTPDYFAEFASQAVGSARGSSAAAAARRPAQIEAVREAFDGGRVARRELEVDEPSSPSAPPRRAGDTARACASASGEWVVCVELDPPKGGSLDGLVEVARALRPRGRSASSTSTTTRWRGRE
jgi:hypothetical protein